MRNHKAIFIACAIEDERIRDVIKGQSINASSPFEYIAVSANQLKQSDWQTKVRTSILRSDGVLAVVTKNSLNSTAQKCEIQYAHEGGIPLRGIWAYKEDTTKLGILTLPWTGSNIANWIDSL